MSDYDIKHPERWLSHAFDRIMDELKYVSPGGRNVALRNAGFRWGRIRHIANGSADTYDAMLADAAMSLGLTKREVQQTLARAIRDGRAEPSPHRIATDADHATAPRLRIGRSAINPDTGDDPPVPFDLEAAPRTTTMDAQAIWSAAQDWLGTPAERYLKEQRGLPSKKILTDLRYSRSRDYHYLVIPVRDDAGEIVAVQRVSINEDGEPAVYPDGRKRKKTIGPSGKGAFVALDTGPDLIVCDGPEDALSIAAACVDKNINARVVAALTSPKRYIAEGVTIFADRDGSLDDITKAAIEAGASIALPPEGCKDANDLWIRGGAEAIAQAIKKAEVGGIKAFPFKPWVTKDLAAIPEPEFVYSDFYARKYTSLTLAPPKVGKSMLGLAESLDMSTGRGILTGHRRDPLRVVYYNAEDDQDVINARVSALLTHYNIDQSEIDGRFWPMSGVEEEDFYLVKGQDGEINERLFLSIEKFIAEAQADALIFDPLQDLSLSPETNEVFRVLGQRLRRMASTTGVALGLVHHTRKVAPGMQATIDDGRGGGALRGTSRFNRILNPMTEDEAASAGVKNHRNFFRITDIESNLAPPSSDVNRWFEKISVGTPAGYDVGAIASWKLPDAFEGITTQKAAHVRNIIDRMEDPPREDVRSTRWAGQVIADALDIDTSEKAGKERVKKIIQKWVKNDVLRVTETYDKRAGREVKVVIAGANNPLIEGDQG